MGFIGAATDATIGMYRVFGCSGDVGADVAISAVNQAFENGTDIITLSFGGASGWTEGPFSLPCRASSLRASSVPWPTATRDLQDCFLPKLQPTAKVSLQSLRSRAL
ncbi:hypothetical protein V8C26DRAFT_400477 [Trichoderma gracile]